MVSGERNSACFFSSSGYHFLRNWQPCLGLSVDASDSSPERKCSSGRWHRFRFANGPITGLSE